MLTNVAKHSPPTELCLQLISKPSTHSNTLKHGSVYKEYTLQIMAKNKQQIPNLRMPVKFTLTVFRHHAVNV